MFKFSLHNIYSFEDKMSWITDFSLYMKGKKMLLPKAITVYSRSYTFIENVNRSFLSILYIIVIIFLSFWFLPPSVQYKSLYSLRPIMFIPNRLGRLIYCIEGRPRAAVPASVSYMSSIHKEVGCNGQCGWKSFNP